MVSIQDISWVKISLYVIIVSAIAIFVSIRNTPQLLVCPETCGPFSNQTCFLYDKCCAWNATSYDSDGAIIGGEGCCYGDGKGGAYIMKNNEIASDKNLLCYGNKFYGTNVNYAFSDNIELCTSVKNFYATKYGWKFGDPKKDPTCLSILF